MCDASSIADGAGVGKGRRGKRKKPGSGETGNVVHPTQFERAVFRRQESVVTLQTFRVLRLYKKYDTMAMSIEGG